MHRDCCCTCGMLLPNNKKTIVYFTRKKNMRTFVCYLIFVQLMIFSMARIYTIYTTRVLSLVWLLILLQGKVTNQ